MATVFHTGWNIISFFFCLFYVIKSILFPSQNDSNIKTKRHVNMTSTIDKTENIIDDQHDNTIGNHDQGSDIILAKGMGLHQGVRGRRCTFNIFCQDISHLQNHLKVHIQGPDNTFSSIYIPSHNNKEQMFESESDSRESLGKEMKLEYRTIDSHQIQVHFFPQRTGKHSLSITWKDRHILSSPYLVRVDDDHSPLVSCSSPNTLQKSRVRGRTLVHQTILFNGIDIALQPEIKLSTKSEHFLESQDNQLMPEPTATTALNSSDMFAEDKIYRTGSSSSLRSVDSNLITMDSMNETTEELLSNPVIVDLILKETEMDKPVDMHLMESVYQTLASDALSSFPNTVCVEREFANLSAHYSLNETRTQEKVIPKKNWRIMCVTRSQSRSPRMEGNDDSKPCISFSLTQCMPVKERKRIFEQNQETKQKRDHTDDNLPSGSLKKLKRQGSLKDKKKFWEQAFLSEEEKVIATPVVKPSLEEIEGSVEILATKQEEDASGGDKPVSVTSEASLPENNPECDQHQEEQEEGEVGVERAQSPESKMFDRSSFEIIEAEEAFHLDSQSPVNVLKSGLTTSTAIKEVKKKRKFLGSSSSHSSHDKNDLVASHSTGEAVESAGEAFIYDEFEDYSSFVGDRYANVVDGQGTGFKLASQLEKMLGVCASKCRAYGAALSQGRTSYENRSEERL